MANHQSALKRIRSDKEKRLRNRYQLKTCRTFVKRLTGTKDPQEAATLFKKVTSMLDKMAKKRIIHKNKAANGKAALSRKLKATQ